MKDPYELQKKEPAKASVWLAAAALGLLALTNVGWLVAYSTLSQKVYSQASSPTPTPRPTPSPTPTPTPRAGTISGSVGYPAGTAPAQSVCAVSVNDSDVKICVDHAAGNNLAYTMQVPAGTYHVYASLKQAQGDFTTSYKAYYNKYVTCTSSPMGCAPGLHTQYERVVVSAGGSVTGVNPTDWYALGVGQ